MIRTYKEEFKSLYLFKGEDTGNFIFVATVNKNRIKKDVLLTRAGEIQSARGMDINLRHLPWDYGGWFGWDSKILTDDFAPVNLYKEMEIDK